MSISRLPSGRWRAQVHDGRVGHNVSVSQILGPAFASFATKAEAKRARERARDLLASPRMGATVNEFRDRWLSDPLFRRPKHSTMIHNTERTKAFAEKYGAVPLRAIGDQVIADWLLNATRHGTVPALRAMWNDALSAKAGRLVDVNPWAGLGIDRGDGNAQKDPPPEEMVWEMIAAGRKQSGVFFAAWLQVACFTGLRPGELDALRWDRIDFGSGLIRVIEQWNATSRTFTTPKNGLSRDAVLTPPAREALLALPRSSAFCFVNLRGEHWTPSARAYHWKAARAAAGWTESLYLATRHFAGWYMVNVLDQESEKVAIALGHTDGGYLVRKLYGHRDKKRALADIAAAYERTGNVKPLRLIREDTAS